MVVGWVGRSMRRGKDGSTIEALKLKTEKPDGIAVNILIPVPLPVFAMTPHRSVTAPAAP